MNEGQGGKERPREWVGERRRVSLVVGKLSLASVSLAPALCLSPFLPFLFPDWRIDYRRIATRYVKVSPLDLGSRNPRNTFESNTEQVATSATSAFNYIHTFASHTFFNGNRILK